MKRKNANLLFVIIFCIIFLDFELFSADNNIESKNVVVKSLDPIVPLNYKYHKLGTLWNRLTNSGEMGDDSSWDRHSCHTYSTGRDYGPGWSCMSWVFGSYHCCQRYKTQVPCFWSHP